MNAHLSKQQKEDPGRKFATIYWIHVAKTDTLALIAAYAIVFGLRIIFTIWKDMRLNSGLDYVKLPSIQSYATCMSNVLLEDTYDAIGPANRRYQNTSRLFNAAAFVIPSHHDLVLSGNSTFID